MFEIDAFLLHYIEEAAHWFQRWTGKDSFFLARVFAFLDALLFSFLIYSRVEAGHLRNHACFFMMLLAGWLYKSAVCGFPEEAKIRGSESRVANPFKHSYFGVWIRYCSFCMACTAVVIIWLDQLNFFDDSLVFACEELLYLTLAFRSCDPLPPCEGKLWESNKKEVSVSA